MNNCSHYCICSYDGKTKGEKQISSVGHRFYKFNCYKLFYMEA